MQTFDSDGTTIAYIDVPAKGGSGDPIVLIHGFASNHAVNWVNTLWVKTLSEAGRRVVALDNRGHGESEKLYEPEAYGSDIMAQDTRRLLDHLGIERADIMGYSMGARISAYLALDNPEAGAFGAFRGPRPASGGGEGLAEWHRRGSGGSGWRKGAQSHGRCLPYLRRTDQKRPSSARRLYARLAPDLVTGGSLSDRGSHARHGGHLDTVAGSAPALAALMPHAKSLELPNRDHSTAVGDKLHRQGVLAFLDERP